MFSRGNLWMKSEDVKKWIESFVCTFWSCTLFIEWVVCLKLKTLVLLIKEENLQEKKSLAILILRWIYCIKVDFVAFEVGGTNGNLVWMTTFKLKGLVLLLWDGFYSIINYYIIEFWEMMCRPLSILDVRIATF